MASRMARTPAEVALVEAFLNTIDLEQFGDKAAKPDGERDIIDTPARLRRWLVDAGLLRPGSRVTARDVKCFNDLRAGLRALLRSEQGLSFDRGRLAQADRVARGVPLSVGLAQSGGPALVPARGGVGGVMERILGDVAIAAATGALARLKVCSADDCQFVFYDHSRSRTQRWCAMETCGNRIKTRRYRERHQHRSGL
jgi:predicted RNA-binding Zn ribbon-like protein